MSDLMKQAKAILAKERQEEALDDVVELLRQKEGLERTIKKIDQKIKEFAK